MNLRHILTQIRKRLRLFAFVFVVFATNLVLGALWINAAERNQWYEPVLYVIGILTALFGLSDIRGLLLAEAELEQQHMAANLITYLEDEGLLYLSLEGDHPEHPKACYHTADEIRKGITDLLIQLSRECKLFSIGSKIREHLNSFMREMEKLEIQGEERESDLSAEQVDSFRTLLLELRCRCAQELVCLGAAYKVNVQSFLDKMDSGLFSLR